MQKNRTCFDRYSSFDFRRSKQALKKCFGHRTHKIYLTALIAFINEISHTSPCMTGKVPNNRQLHAVIRELLEDLSCHAIFQIEKFHAEIFLIKNDFIKTLIIEIAH